MLTFISDNFFILPHLLLKFHKSFDSPNEGYNLTLKYYIGLGISTMMSILDGLGPSIFCRKMV